MKYAFEPYEGSFVFIYFDSDVFKGIEHRVYDVGHLATEPLPWLIKEILNVYGIMSVSIQCGLACVERYDPTEPFRVISEKVANTVCDQRYAGVSRVSELSIEEFKNKYPGIVVHEPPTE